MNQPWAQFPTPTQRVTRIVLRVRSFGRLINDPSGTEVFIARQRVRCKLGPVLAVVSRGFWKERLGSTRGTLLDSPVGSETNGAVRDVDR